MNAYDLRKRAWWLRGIASRLTSPEVAEALRQIADEMAGRALMLEASRPDELDHLRHGGQLDGRA